MSYNIEDLVTVRGRGAHRDRHTIEVEAAKAYPVTVARILEILESRKFPQEMVGILGDIDYDPYQAARSHVNAAKRVPEYAWALALETPDGLEPQALEDRASALDVVRRWVTRAVKMQYLPDCDAGCGLHLHILDPTKHYRDRL